MHYYSSFMQNLGFECCNSKKFTFFVPKCLFFCHFSHDVKALNCYLSHTIDEIKSEMIELLIYSI